MCLHWTCTCCLSPFYRIFVCKAGKTQISYRGYQFAIRMHSLVALVELIAVLPSELLVPSLHMFELAIMPAHEGILSLQLHAPEQRTHYHYMPFQYRSQLNGAALFELSRSVCIFCAVLFCFCARLLAHCFLSSTRYSWWACALFCLQALFLS